MVLDNDFWRFSLAAYAQNGVPTALLALQDRWSADVSLILFAIFVVRNRKDAVETAEIAAWEGGTRAWREASIAPLRSTRRCLKVDPDIVPAEIRQLVRKKIADAELLAEQIEQAILFEQFFQTSSCGSIYVRDLSEAAVYSVLRFYGATAPYDRDTSEAVRTVLDAVEVESDQCKHQPQSGR